jgi:hypothetical protein
MKIGRICERSIYRQKKYKDRVLEEMGKEQQHRRIQYDVVNNGIMVEEKETIISKLKSY